MSDLEVAPLPGLLAWPPAVLPTNRSDSTPQQAVHSADHNSVNQSVNDLVTVVSDVIRLPPQLYTGTPFAVNPITHDSTLQFVNIAADPQVRIGTVSAHLLVTVGTAPLNIAVVITGAQLMLWTLSTVGDHYIDGSTSFTIPANTALTAATVSGANPAGPVSRTWGGPEVNRFTVTLVRGAQAATLEGTGE